MKINVEVDCTPEEARRFLGLPDLTALHERYVARMGELMEGRVQPEMLEAMLKGWAPMNEAGAAFWRRLFDRGARED